jgi:hypothetical protein
MAGAVLPSFLYAGVPSVDVTEATIVTSENMPAETATIVSNFVQSALQERTGIRWKTAAPRQSTEGNIILFNLELEEQASNQKTPSKDAEGYRVATSYERDKIRVSIYGTSKAGLLFGAGHLLRNIKYLGNRLVLDDDIQTESGPVYAVRGHQLGYRNKANSYDAWSVAQYERYIRELMVFGTNAIENIPVDERLETDHMIVSRADMNRSLSDICERYGIQYWLWTPITVDISDKQTFMQELRRHEAVYQSTPMISEIFVPGGDPGNNHPRDVLPFLQSLDSLLKKYHPNAGLWLSLQKFDEEEVDYFYAYIEKHDPDWLKGIVSGPSSPPIAETRHRLPKKYRHRLYPDITHTVRCEYPPKNLDQAFALTLGREGINPLPYHHAGIHRKYVPFSDGFVSYSDGCHDDVNKVVWSMLGWDPDLSVSKILAQYCRYHFGETVAQTAAEGTAALETNMAGPLFMNNGVELTFSHWQVLEENNPQLVDNWRWQMLVLRAYYDVYLRRRLLYEQSLEEEAYTVLQDLDAGNLEGKLDQALKVVQKADTEPIEGQIRGRITELCDRLFHSIGLQTSVEKYRAENSQRGCILDFVDYPLNNRWWLEDEFAKIVDMPDSNSRMERLHAIRTWENPGPGSYYDNVSNIAQSPHVKSTVYDAVDFAWWDSGYSRARLSSQVFQNQPVLEYENLDPNGRYVILLAGYGDALIRVDNERLKPTVYNKEAGSFKEFVVPRTAVGDGMIRVTFDVPEESHLRWSKYSRISDVWLIKK